MVQMYNPKIELNKKPLILKREEIQTSDNNLKIEGHTSPLINRKVVLHKYCFA